MADDLPNCPVPGCDWIKKLEDAGEAARLKRLEVYTHNDRDK